MLMAGLRPDSQENSDKVTLVISGETICTNPVFELKYRIMLVSAKLGGSAKKYSCGLSLAVENFLTAEITLTLYNPNKTCFAYEEESCRHQMANSLTVTVTHEELEWYKQ